MDEMLDEDQKKEQMYRDMALDQVRQKYLGDKYSDENRQKIIDQNKEDSSGPNWAAGLSAFGAGLAGGNAAQAGAQIKQAQENARQSKIDAFDTGRKQQLADFETGRKIKDMERDDAKLAREIDPGSQESMLAQSLAKKMVPGRDFAAMSAQDINKLMPSLTKVYDIEQRKLDRGDARADRMLAQNEKREEKLQGLKTPYGLANTVEDAKSIKEAHESKQGFDSKIQEMIDLRKKYGGEFMNREAVARGKQLSKDLLLEYKNMAKLGVLSKSDEDIINAIIPQDPLAFSAAGLTGQDPILSNLQKFKQDSNRDFATRVATRTRDGGAQYAAGKQAQDPTKSAGNPGKVRVSNGKETLEIDPEDLAHAQKDGYSRV